MRMWGEGEMHVWYKAAAAALGRGMMGGNIMFPGLSVLCCALFVYLHYANLLKKKIKEKQLGIFFLWFYIFLNSRVDIAHLCLYNLSVIHKKKYFDSELELMAYINENWDRLHPGEVSSQNVLSSPPFTVYVSGTYELFYVGY